MDDQVEINQIVYRPWGTYTVLEVSGNHKIKNIKVNPDERLSLQLHKHRSEHWVVVSGRACVHVDGSQQCLVDGETSLVLG